MEGATAGELAGFAHQRSLTLLGHAVTHFPSRKFEFNEKLCHCLTAARASSAELIKERESKDAACPKAVKQWHSK